MQIYLNIVSLTLYHCTIKLGGYMVNNITVIGRKEHTKQFLKEQRFCQSFCIQMWQYVIIWANLVSTQFTWYWATYPIGKEIGLMLKSCWAIFSYLNTKNISQKNSPSFKLVKQYLYQYSLDILTWPLLNYQHYRFDLQIDNNSL